MRARNGELHFDGDDVEKILEKPDSDNKAVLYLSIPLGQQIKAGRSDDRDVLDVTPCQSDPK